MFSRLQGVLPFYYTVKAPAGAQLVVDHCKFNNMGDCERCLNMDPSAVSIVHFTVCQKPWCAPVPC